MRTHQLEDNEAEKTMTKAHQNQHTNKSPE